MNPYTIDPKEIKLPKRKLGYIAPSIRIDNPAIIKPIKTTPKRRGFLCGYKPVLLARV